MEIRICSKEDLQEVYALRFEVFVAEQKVPPEEELDAFDPTATHILCTEGGVAVACGRIVPMGSSALLGRICVKKTHRRKGYGAALCRFMLAEAKKQGYARCEIHAQLHAIPFYETLGFRPYGDVFPDAGIPHRSMELFL